MHLYVVFPNVAVRGRDGREGGMISGYKGQGIVNMRAGKGLRESFISVSTYIYMYVFIHASM